MRIVPVDEARPLRLAAGDLRVDRHHAPPARHRSRQGRSGCRAPAQPGSSFRRSSPWRRAQTPQRSRSSGGRHGRERADEAGRHRAAEERGRAQERAARASAHSRTVAARFHVKSGELSKQFRGARGHCSSLQTKREHRLGGLRANLERPAHAPFAHARSASPSPEPEATPPRSGRSGRRCDRRARRGCRDRRRRPRGRCSTIATCPKRHARPAGRVHEGVARHRAANLEDPGLVRQCPGLVVDLVEDGRAPRRAVQLVRERAARLAQIDLFPLDVGSRRPSGRGREEVGRELGQAVDLLAHRCESGRASARPGRRRGSGSR